MTVSSGTQAQSDDTDSSGSMKSIIRNQLDPAVFPNIF